MSFKHNYQPKGPARFGQGGWEPIIEREPQSKTNNAFWNVIVLIALLAAVSAYFYFFQG